MPKMKTHSGTSKRVRVTGTGKLRRHLGWQPHTLRAAICRLPIKAKHTRVDGVTSYQISSSTRSSCSR